MKIKGFEWDEANALHLELKHGITPQEAEEVFAIAPFFRKTKRGHYAAFDQTGAGRFLLVIFEVKNGNCVRIITAWDMKGNERRYYNKQTKG